MVMRGDGGDRLQWAEREEGGNGGNVATILGPRQGGSEETGRVALE